MGIDWGDVDNDGLLDFFVATYQGQTKTLYHSRGQHLFQEESEALGIDASTKPYVAWGCKFLDADNDGWLDLLIANGHLEDNVAQIPVPPGESERSYRQRPQFLHNSGKQGVFVDASSTAGPAFSHPLVGRGLSVGDFDNDGGMDALVVDSEGVPVLLHNTTPSKQMGHFVGFHLVGTGKSNRDGYGATITLTLTDHTGERVLTRFCHADGSYLSSSDKRVHFGLGSGKGLKVKQATIKWPDGKSENRQIEKIDAYYEWVEKK